ncbi:hypothetical protein GQ42DRAFT_23423 [Ramicandelaber brevisporus]|nr:hypothetical protein GQ42DRAFT_23423 [Ramicandelaber brevisporus]
MTNVMVFSIDLSRQEAVAFEFDQLATLHNLHRVLIKVAFDPRPPALNRLLEWINDSSKSGHVISFWWTIATPHSSRLQTLRAFNSIGNLRRHRFELTTHGVVVDQSDLVQIQASATKMSVYSAERHLCSSPTLQSFFGNPGERFSQLKQLHLGICCCSAHTYDYTSFTPAMLPSLSKFSILQMSEPGCIDQFGSPIDRILLHTWPRITDFSWYDQASKRPLPVFNMAKTKMPCLQRLYYHTFDGFVDLAPINTNLQHLVHLVINSVKEIRFTQSDTALLKWNQLRTLELIHVEISDDVMRFILTSAPHLQRLHLLWIRLSKEMVASAKEIAATSTHWKSLVRELKISYRSLKTRNIQVLADKKLFQETVLDLIPIFGHLEAIGIAKNDVDFEQLLYNRFPDLYVTRSSAS